MADALPSITGDIAAAADVTVNTKGGSYTAILKKSLRERLGRIGDHLTGAAIQFANGQAIVVLAGGMASDAAFGNEFRVRQIARNRFEIELQDGEGDEVDEVTASFLRMKKDQFEKGQLRFSNPMTAEDWQSKLDHELDDARRLAQSARAKKRKPVTAS